MNEETQSRGNASVMTLTRLTQSGDDEKVHFSNENIHPGYSIPQIDAKIYMHKGDFYLFHR